MAFKDNLKIIREFRGKKKADIAKYLGIGRQNLTNWETGPNEPGPDILDNLSNCLQVPRELLYKKDLTKEYLEKNFSGKNHTPMPKANDNKEKAIETIYKDLVESNSEYRLVPKIILDSYEIIPKRELEERAAIVRQALDAKDDVIGQLKKEIAQLRSGELIIMHPQKTE